ncbi:MAG: nitronate monooxygenase [Planctomycetes bacterium]|nr:nitronate monooxygenase [Planctomycetota bacterium]
MKALVIGKLRPRLPVMQGALGYIGSPSFVAAVARAGALGTIASLGLTPEELRKQIAEVRSQCSEGDLFGVNLLVPATTYPAQVEVCLEQHVHFVELAAGMDKQCGRIHAQGGPAVIYKVSSLRLAQYAEQLGAAAVVVMGKEAGGHLGFPQGVPFVSTADLVRSVKPRVSIPVIAAGGAVDDETAKPLFEAGADAIQVGTRLLATHEFQSHPSFKAALVHAGADEVLVIDSPFGLPLRALSTRFARGQGREAFDVEDCVRCLPTCRKTYCLRAAMRRALAGQVQDGIIPASENTPRICTLLTLSEALSEMLRLS